MTTLEAKTRIAQQEAHDEKQIDRFSAACFLIVVLLISLEAWRFA